MPFTPPNPYFPRDWISKMIRPRNGWRVRLVGVLSIPKRLALAAASLWPRNKRMTSSHEWDPVPPPSFSSNFYNTSLSPVSSPLDPYIVSYDVDYKIKRPRGIDAGVLISSSQPPPLEESSQTPPVVTVRKRLTFGEIPFSVITQCAPSELPEDVERLIFEIAARDDRQAALHTLVFVNDRVRKWVEYIIYESVILRDAKHARLFLDGLELKHPDFAAGAVKILALPKRVSFDTSFKILSICRDIRHLSWLPINPLSPEIVNLIATLPLVSLRARLSSFMGSNPDFSAPLFDGLTTLFVADHEDVWKTWKWNGLRSTRSKLKWLAFNLDGRLQTLAGWAPVRTLEKMVLHPYGGAMGIRLCVCYSYNPSGSGDRWIHRSEDTFSEERMVVLSLTHRIDEKEWEKRISGERRDFEISEDLVKERQTKERRLRFQLYRTSLVFLN